MWFFFVGERIGVLSGRLIAQVLKQGGPGPIVTHHDPGPGVRMREAGDQRLDDPVGVDACLGWRGAGFRPGLDRYVLLLAKAGKWQPQNQGQNPWYEELPMVRKYPRKLGKRGYRREI